MKIKTVDIINFKKIRTAQITFNDGITKVGGSNGAGKSSIYEAIWTALLGKEYVGKGTSAEKLITTGGTKSEISVKLEGTDKTIKVRRRINEVGDMYLEAFDSDMNKLTQKDINALCSSYAVDPHQFTRLSKKDQFLVVQKATGLDTSDLDDERATVYSKRTDANAIYKSYKSQIDLLGDVKKVDRVNTNDLISQLQSQTEHNQLIIDKQNKVKVGEEYITQIDNNIEELNKQLLEIQENIQKKTKMKFDGMEKVISLKQELEKLSPIDLTEIQSKIEKAEETNLLATKWDNYLSLKEQSITAETKAIELDNRIKAIDEEKNQRVKDANMPIENMEISENDGIIINKIPFSQYSTAEQIIMACRIATATNPEIKLIGIKDGSLLDDSSMDKLEKFAQECGYQFYIERVGEEIDALIIRDGEVVVSYNQE